MISDVQSIIEDRLREESSIVSLNDVTDKPSFVEPIKLYETWQALPGKIPHYQNIKPNIFNPKVLPYIYILDVIAKDHPDNVTEDIDFRFRLFGTGSRNNYGREGTQRFLSEMAHAGSGNAFDISKLAYETGEAQFLKGAYFKGDTLVKTSSFVVLPLSGDDGSVNRLFGCGMWFNA